MKTPSLPRSTTIDKVLLCIKECFNKCERVTHWIVQERSRDWRRGYIDRREALAALESLAPTPGEPVRYEELDSCLTRSNNLRDLLLNAYPKEWWYDAEGCEVFPVFPLIHEILARRFPILHSLLFPNSAHAQQAGGCLKEKTYHPSIAIECGDRKIYA
jgi:hypothetical protein